MLLMQAMIVYLYKLGAPMSTYTILIAALAMESGEDTNLFPHFIKMFVIGDSFSI